MLWIARLFAGQSDYTVGPEIHFMYLLCVPHLEPITSAFSDCIPAKNGERLRGRF